MANKNINILNKDNFSKEYFEGTDYDLSTISNGNLNIYRIGDDLKTCQSALSSHKLSFYMICLIRSGEGIYTFGADEYYLQANTLCFVSQHLFTSWHAQSLHQDGYCCTFSEEFVKENEWFKQLPFFQLGSNMVMPLSEEQTTYYADLMESMIKEIKEEEVDIVRTQLQLFLRKGEAAFNRNKTVLNTANRAGLQLTKAFLEICRQDISLLMDNKINSLATPAAYAEKLHVSQNHLNDTVKGITGMSIGQHLQFLLVTEATNLLKHTSLTISEIAFKLGFNDASYFSRFYKKQKHISPSSFR